MISRKLRRIFIFSIPIFMAHGIEEYLTGFYDSDPISVFVFKPFSGMAVSQATFGVFQIMVWILLVVSALLLSKSWQWRLVLIPGIIYLFEIHHLIEAIVRWSYYPGSLTAIAFPILAFFFWKEFFQAFRSPRASASSA